MARWGVAVPLSFLPPLLIVYIDITTSHSLFKLLKICYKQINYEWVAFKYSMGLPSDQTVMIHVEHF